MFLTLGLVWTGKALVFVEVMYALGRHKAAVSKLAYQQYLKYDLIDWIQVCFSMSDTFFEC